MHTIYKAVIRSLNETSTYELLRHHMGHAAKHNMKKLTDMVDGVPKLLSKNPIYKYPHCITSIVSTNQLTIALRSIEVEFVAVYDTKNTPPYSCTILDELGLEQD